MDCSEEEKALEAMLASLAGQAELDGMLASLEQEASIALASLEQA